MKNTYYFFLTCTYYANVNATYFLHIISETGFDYCTDLTQENGRKALLLLEKRAGRSAWMDVNRFDPRIHYKTIEVKSVI